jgi:prepilin-type N-terminal cleavage/methylation domain-containing protein
MRLRRTERGYTLLEMIVVIVILVVLLVIAMGVYHQIVSKSHVAAATHSLTLAFASSQEAASDNGRFPADATQVAGQINFDQPELSTQVSNGCGAAIGLGDKTVELDSASVNPGGLVMSADGGSGAVVVVAAGPNGEHATGMASDLLGKKPEKVAKPLVSGSPLVGQTLSAAPGAWLSCPDPSFTYRWQTSSDDTVWSDITSATSATYLLALSDARSTVRVVVTATNPTGSASNQSSPTSVITVDGATTTPFNTEQPSIIGDGQEGQPVTVDVGSWTTSPSSYGIAWRQCDASGTNCTDIPGATGTTYVPTSGVVGSTIRVSVTGENSSGSSPPAQSNPLGPIASGKPEVTTEPSISGNATDGQTLAASNGVWTNSPTSYTYQWQRCSGGGLSNCTALSGATSSSYVLTSADVLNSIRVKVTAGNSVGSTTTASSPVGPVNGEPPSNSVLPTVPANPQDGQLVTASKGTWSGTSPLAYSYQWQVSPDGVNGWSSIAGATASSYRVPYGTYTGDYLRIRVIASNVAGPVTSYSTPSSAVAAAPPSNTAAPSLSGTAQDGQTLSTTNGSWIGTPTISYSYQWQRAAISSGPWSIIGGATSASYTVQPTDINQYLRAQVTGSNGAGAVSAPTTASAKVTSIPVANTVQPSFTGTPQDGQTLAGNKGTWTGSPTIAYSYQWQRSANGTSGWSNIGGATAINYTLTSSDYNNYVRLQVTGDNTYTNATALSAASAQVNAVAPSNTVAPSLSGTAQDGQTVSTTNGTWVGTPTITYTYQWQFSASSGGPWSNIGGATSSSYAIPYGTYTGKYLRAAVTATNTGGSATSFSASSAAIAGATPSNTVAPVASGTAKDGQTVSTTNGTWAGTPTISSTYQWQFSASSGGPWSNIGGATSSSYAIPYGTYTGKYLRAEVTGTNVYGNSSASSNALGPVVAAAPSNTAAPSLSGTAKDGQTVSTTNGTWVGTPTISYTYQWQFSASSGGPWSNIGGATSSSYAIPYGTHTGKYLRAAVTASNAAGAATADSAASAQVAAAPPVNTSLPTTSGTATVGNTLTASNGSWTGTPTISYTYQWQSSANGTSGWTNISGATASAYTIQPADTNNYLHAEVTASNVGGTATASSAPTSRVIGQTAPGMIVAYAGVLPAPSGWALADGSCGYTSAAVPDLWTAIGTTYGGSGSSNFCLPDLRGRIPLGKASSGTGSTLGSTGGALDQSGSLNPWGTLSVSFSWNETAPAPAAISHTHAAINGNVNGQSGGGGSDQSTGYNRLVFNSANETFSTQATSVSTSTSPLTPSATTSVSNPPYRVIHYLIQTQSSGAVPCGALWGYGAAAAPSGASLADGSSASGCLDSAYSGVLPDLRGRFAIGQGTSGSASSLNGAGGAINQSVSATLIASETQGTVTSSWSSTLVEGSHSHGTSWSGSSHLSHDYAWNGSYAARSISSNGANSNAGANYTSNTYAPTLATSGAGAQSSSSATFSTAYEAVNWIGYSGSNALVTSGAISPFAGSVSPAGWLLANGSCYSTGTYANLFAVIGYVYGGSGGSFCLPNLSGRFPFGKATSGTGSTLGASGGTLAPSPTLTFTGWTPTLTVPAHTFQWSVPAHTHTVTVSTAYSEGNGSGTPLVVGANSNGSDRTYTSGAGGGGTVTSTVSQYSVNATAPVGSAETNPSVSPPPFLAVNYVIKY